MMSDGDLTIFDDELADKTVRRVWHDGRWFYSVIDVIGFLTESKQPRKYWTAMKARIHDEGFRELTTKCRQLKLPARDGKSYLTDAADEETILRVVQSVPSPRAEPFKQWLARVGAERLQEMEDPSLAPDRMRRDYERLGYSDEWIAKRLENVAARNELTAEWRERGAEEGREFALLTDTLNQGAFDLTTSEHRQVKRLSSRQNLRDSMTPLELVLTSLAEVTATTMHQAHDSQGFTELRHDAHEAGDVAGSARRDIEARLGQPVVSPVNYKQLRQERRRELQPPLMDEHDGVE